MVAGIKSSGSPSGSAMAMFRTPAFSAARLSPRSAIFAGEPEGVRSSAAGQRQPALVAEAFGQRDHFLDALEIGRALAEREVVAGAQYPEHEALFERLPVLWQARERLDRLGEAR